MIDKLKNIDLKKVSAGVNNIGHVNFNKDVGNLKEDNYEKWKSIVNKSIKEDDYWEKVRKDDAEKGINWCGGGGSHCVGCGNFLFRGNVCKKCRKLVEEI
ncbi:MAG: hypothetical protein RsTaC01_0972 [Candidatus Paraimprobicoccus trichonymphae]|uniref:Uncharacterized protein n=1 Tax=Candidatus Paraimprobicoccus trichonymphae TaxID=3033793 RepID=A0AA48HX43_9FIRM|nr:MAG: hypothetical protein RsTaC01_0972 [Candidatus Paraimprobicoccus trichonymphae]